MTPNPNLTSPPSSPPVPRDDDDAAAPRASDPKFFWLTVFQYLLIAAVTLLFVYAIVGGLRDVSQLKNIETARGLITFVITLGTVTIAVILALTAVVIRDFDKRIGVGKEILTVLVGVLGTIVGFYYGASDRDRDREGAEPQITVAAPQLTATQRNATLTGKIEGGTAPYEYSITFPDSTIQQINDTSADGSIQANFELPDPVPAEVIVTIEGTDKNGVAFSHNKDGSIKTKVQPK